MRSVIIAICKIPTQESVLACCKDVHYVLPLAAEVIRYLGVIIIAWLQYIAARDEDEHSKLLRRFCEVTTVTVVTLLVSNADTSRDWIVVVSLY